jgi:subfamily B ATP-binding cassette protein MsbA
MSLVIAHRLSMVPWAATILVRDHGRLVELGTHAELLALSGVHAHLYEMQLRHAREDISK